MGTELPALVIHKQRHVAAQERPGGRPTRRGSGGIGRQLGLAGVCGELDHLISFRRKVIELQEDSPFPQTEALRVPVEDVLRAVVAQRRTATGIPADAILVQVGGPRRFSVDAEELDLEKVYCAQRGNGRPVGACELELNRDRPSCLSPLCGGRREEHSPPPSSRRESCPPPDRHC